MVSQVGEFLKTVQMGGVPDVNMDRGGVDAEVDVKFAFGAEDFFQLGFAWNDISYTAGEKVGNGVHEVILAGFQEVEWE